jgi:hypothetical protein
VSKRFPYPTDVALADVNELITGDWKTKANRGWGITGVLLGQFLGHPDDGAPPLKSLDLDDLSEESVDFAMPISTEEIQAYQAETPEGAAAIGALELFALVRFLATLKKHAPELYALARKVIDKLRGAA